jgi:hypothetical protein
LVLCLEITPEFSVWPPYAGVARFITQEEGSDYASNKFSPQPPAPRPDVVHFLLFTSKFVVLDPKRVIPAVLLKHVIGASHTNEPPNSRQRRPSVEPFAVPPKVNHSANLGMSPRTPIFALISSSSVLTKPYKVADNAVLCGVN